MYQAMISLLFQSKYICLLFDTYAEFHRPNGDPIRVTSGGNSSVFHAVPDWVYEEEVFSGDSALWWSPDSSRIAFLRFDETNVDEFSFPIYNPTTDGFETVPYPSSVHLKYPMPGYNNPIVSAHVFHLKDYLGTRDDKVAQDIVTLSWEGQRKPEDSIIQEVTWISGSSLIIKEINRSGNEGTVLLFDLATDPTRKGRIVRKLGKNGEEGDDGWIDAVSTIITVHHHF